MVESNSRDEIKQKGCHTLARRTFEVKSVLCSRYTGTIIYLHLCLGTYSTITVTFFFKRRLGYFLIQVYLPNVFVVLLSWIVFWMQKDDIGNRMALGITCILTIMFLLGSLNGNLPKVSYPKAMDWYLLMSFVFVFLALVECIIVYVLNLSATQDRERIKCKVCYGS